MAHNKTLFKLADVKEGISNRNAEDGRKVEHVIRIEEFYEREMRVDTSLEDEQLDSFRFYVSDSETDDSSSSDESDDDNKEYANADELPTVSESELWFSFPDS